MERKFVLMTKYRLKYQKVGVGNAEEKSFYQCLQELQANQVVLNILILMLLIISSTKLQYQKQLKQ